MARRARGGFCFGSPNDIMSYPDEAYQINADLAGGALQGICEAWEAIATIEEATIRIDLLYTKLDPAYALTCPPPGQEPITVRLIEAKNLQVRIPSWAHPSDVAFQMNGMPRTSAADTATDGYLQLTELESGSEIKIFLPSRREIVSEVIGGQTYDVEWHNDTVVGICPPARFQALYGRD